MVNAATVVRGAFTLFVAFVLLGCLAFLAAPDVSAASTAELPANEHLMPNAAPDEGGTDSANAKAAEWFEFSILLAPFLVLVTALLILVFGWDRFTGTDE